MPIFLLIILFLFTPTLSSAAWGPKLKLHLQNDAEETANIYIGVDTNATDDYDKDMLFPYNDTTIKENLDLPPFGFGFAVYLIRDTLTAIHGSFSYVDMRSISREAQFMHRYVALMHWNIVTNTPFVDVRWDELPEGIDSAKIRCKEWHFSTPSIDMLSNANMRIDIPDCVTLFIDVWYNKKPNDIAEYNAPPLLTPNPANDLININIPNIKACRIYNMAGNELPVNDVESYSKGMIININHLAPGAYSLLVEQTNGKSKTFSFIKR